MFQLSADQSSADSSCVLVEVDGPQDRFLCECPMSFTAGSDSLTCYCLCPEDFLMSSNAVLTHFFTSKLELSCELGRVGFSDH